MRILIDSCSYTAQNIGDLAMLTVAVSRLRELWPDASIQVITGAPDNIKRLCPDVETIPVSGRQLVLQQRLLGRFERLLPPMIAERWHAVEDRFRSRYPAVLGFAQQLKSGSAAGTARDVSEFLAAVDRADLLVVCGSGVLADGFPESALGVLATLEMGAQRGIPTAMFGQGLGPLESAALRSRAAEVLPRVRLVALRERLASLPLLASLGMSPDRVVVTGDDAIELAQQDRAADPDLAEPANRNIGVNLRVASYSKVGREHFDVLRQALRSASQAHDAGLVALPIAHKRQLDVTTLRELLAGLAADGDPGGASLTTPERVIRRIRQCRVVVTGSYHVGVFALAQGIPAVALVSSRYYGDKMTGLADQFGGGCEVVTLDGALSASRISEAIGAAWESADRVRPALLARAADQVASGRAAYARLLNIVAH